jgi:molybdopterin-containing oxidoreductase family membrane subunit
MREQVSWGFYISNFTFLVGVAAAAVLLVIPAYLYHFKAIKKIVAFGELLAVTAVVMALLFVFVDIGRPDRLWHMIPGLGTLNFPSSVLAWDMLVLNGYLLLNLVIATYIGFSTYFGKEPNKRIVIPLVLLSIPWAIGVHTVTAFVYNGMSARPFWSASILAPRFLASAFCSGPALMIIIFQILRKVANFKIRNRAIFKLAEIITYAMTINLFLMFAEIYKEVYTDTIHLAPMTYLYGGLHGHNNLVPWIWTAMVFNTIGFFLFLVPKTRRNFITLNIGCVLIFVGIWIEKEVMIAVSIWAFGALIYTFFVRTTIALETGRLRHPGAAPISLEEDEGPVAKDIMTCKVISVSPETTIEEMSKRLVAKRITGVPVVDEKNKVVGVVSESDIIFAEIHQEPHLVERLKKVVLPETHEIEGVPGTTASEIMTSPPITAREETPLIELIEMTTEKKIKRIFIVDKEGHLVGVVSKIDLVKALENI